MADGRFANRPYKISPNLFEGGKPAQFTRGSKVPRGAYAQRCWSAGDSITARACSMRSTSASTMSLTLAGRR